MADTIDASKIQNIEKYTYYEFSNTDGPIEVCPVTSNNLNFKMKWIQPDTAKQCHANAKIIYDKIRSEEDALLASTAILKTPGVTMIQLDYINSNVNKFAQKKESLVNFNSVTMPPNSSTELSGYFEPTISGLYKFTPTNECLIWIGDVACYEFLPENATVGEIELTKGRYYYVRFQAKNATTVSSSMTITVTCNNQTVSDPKFVILTSGSERYIRKLLYYGLVRSETPGTYYCYFNNGDNYYTILNNKGINIQHPISKIIPSDYNTPPSSDTASFAENGTVKLNLDSNLFDTKIRSAAYGTTHAYTVYDTKTTNEPETDPDKVNEKYIFTENRDVPTNKTRYVPQSYIEKNVPYPDSKLECYQPATTQSCAEAVCSDNITGYQQKKGKCADPVCTPNITGYQQKQGPITGYQQKQGPITGYHQKQGPITGWNQKQECSGYNWKTARYNKNCKMVNTSAIYGPNVNDETRPIYGPNVNGDPIYGPNVNDETKPNYGTPNCAAPVCEMVNDLDNPIKGPQICAAPVCTDVIPGQVCTTVQFTNYRDETRTRDVEQNYMENVSTPFSTEKSRIRVPPPPDKVITEQVPRTIDPIKIDVTDTVRGNIAGGFQANNTTFGKDPVPGQVKSLSIEYSNTLKDSAKADKEIYINDKCEVTVAYKTANISGSIFAPSCSEKMVRLNNDGTVSVSGAIWIENPLSKEEQKKLVPNPKWLSYGLSNILNVGSPLYKLVSPNGMYMLMISSSKRLLYRYCFKTFFEESDGTKVTMSEKAFYLYRPSYSELGGKKFMQNQNKELVRIQPNDANLVFHKFSAIGNGQPTSLLDSYSKFDSGDCAKKCEESITCGNYVTGPNNLCYVDTKTITNPTYITTSKMSGYSIYTKQYNMKTDDKSNDDGIRAFESEPSGMYSTYAFIPDAIKTEGFESNITKNLSGITELLNQHNQLKKKQEGFSDIPARFSNTLPLAPDTSVEEGRIEDLQEIMFQQNMMYSIGSIAAVSFLVGAIVLARN